MDGYERVTDLLKALGHPVRLQIMEILGEEEEACVCHFEHTLGYRQAYISQQLARLREAALIRDRREGLNVYYSLSSETIEPFLNSVKDLAGEVTPGNGDSLRYERKTQNRERACPCPNCAAMKSNAPKLFDTLREQFAKIRS